MNEKLTTLVMKFDSQLKWMRDEWQSCQDDEKKQVWMQRIDTALDFRNQINSAIRDE